MVETVTFDFHARPLGTAPPPTSTMETPESDISAIQSGNMQPLPTYSEHDNLFSQPLLSSVDLNDTRHVPPTYTEEITPLPIVDENSALLPDSRKDLFTSDNNDSASTHPATHSSISETNAINEEEETDEAYAKILQEQETNRQKQNIIREYFLGIKQEKPDVIDLFISRGLVTANTVDEDGQTPLLAAVATKNIKIVQQLLDLGAEPDAFGVVDRKFDPTTTTYAESRFILTQRTPLMLASSLGHLPLVKLLMENYHCSDARIAPDGQIALRLASSNNHREVVSYLPSRRAGGFLRWKTAHQKSIRRINRAINSIYEFFKFFTWTIPKFFLWTCPKHMIVLPIVKGCKYCWENKERFKNHVVAELKRMPERTSRAAQACRRGIAKIPSITKDVSKATWRGIKKIPSATVQAAKWLKGAILKLLKAIWEFVTVDVPRFTKAIGKWLFNFLFVKIPSATSIAAKWVWSGIVSLTSSIWNIVTRVISAIHTFFTALSLKDILNGIKSILEAVFVTFPKTILKWLGMFGDVSWKVLKGLFGCLGMCIWCLIRGLIWVVEYIPRKIAVIFAAVVASIGKGAHEILVWVSPKA